MFEQLFEGPHALARQRAGPLVEERLGYLDHLANQGMARESLRHAAYYLLAVAGFLRLADRPGEALGLSEIEQKAILWANRSPRPPEGKERRYARATFRWYATGWLRFLGRLQPPPPRSRPHADRIDAFADYLRHERGLSPRTVDTYCPTVEAFLGDLGRSGHALEDLTITHLDEALLARITRGGYARTTVQGLARALRSFFGYAHRRGWCHAGLAPAIKAPRVYAQESLPAGPSWQDVQRLLASTEGDRPTDIRDRAILMLLAIYGFRAGEVVRLRLQDFDWQREQLCLTRPKTQTTQVYPLSRRVGDAVLRYLVEVRPRCPLRQVFLSRRAPLRPLSRSALWPLVAERVRGLGMTVGHRGPHVLRHACATHLLEQGLSLKEIGDHLGHQHPDTTRLYAKVDLTGLRQVADFDLGGLLVNLHQLIEQYITFRQTLGERFRTNAAYLRAFGRAIGVQAEITDVGAEQVNAFLAGAGPITSSWHVRHNALLGFYRYATSRGYVACAPLPAVLPKRPGPFVPYIFSHQELRRLVDAAGAHQERRGCLEAGTLRTLVLLLYGTGLRVGEAVRLDCQDVNLDNALLTVRRSKFYKSRLVPFGPQLKTILADYNGPRPVATAGGGEPGAFLTTRAGRRVNQHTLQACYRRVCDKASIRRGDGASYQPRLHDLRHTFAVHRLTSWYRQGADVQKLLPHLSVYLGHAHLAATQVYLSMTPELLAQANARFARYAEQEVGHD